jgi:hypothetical protein
MLPRPDALLRDTPWARLEHALGAAGDTPAALDGLRAADSRVAARSLRHLEQTVHHQNSIYSATVPAALFVAAVLAETSVGTTEVDRPGEPPRSLRAVLLDWLAEMADDVSDAAAEAMREHGFAPMEARPAMLELRAWRPAMVKAIMPYATDPEPSVRHAAVIAAARLSDSPERVRSAVLVEPLREVAASSLDERHRAGAAELLAAEGRPSPAARMTKEEQ